MPIKHTSVGLTPALTGPPKSLESLIPQTGKSGVESVSGEAEGQVPRVPVSGGDRWRFHAEQARTRVRLEHTQS